MSDPVDILTLRARLDELRDVRAKVDTVIHGLEAVLGAQPIAGASRSPGSSSPGHGTRSPGASPPTGPSHARAPPQLPGSRHGPYAGRDSGLASRDPLATSQVSSAPRSPLRDRYGTFGQRRATLYEHSVETPKPRPARLPEGLSDEDTVVYWMDVLFVVVAIVSCMLAGSGVGPRGAFVDHPIRLEQVLAFYAFSSVFTVAWVLLRFRVHTTDDAGRVVDTLPAIKARYIQTWFGFDLVYAAPVEWLFVGWATWFFFVLQLRHVLRLARCFSLSRRINPLAPGTRRFRFAALSCACILAIHMSAQLFAEMEDRRYLTGLYWTVVTMTSVGYGDVLVSDHAFNRIVAIVVAAVGVCIISAATAFATALLSRREMLAEKFDGRRQVLHTMLRYYRIPYPLQREALAVLPAVLDAERMADFSVMTDSMPRFLGDRLRRYARAHMLRGVPVLQAVFQGSELRCEQALLALAGRLHRRWAAAHETVIATDETAPGLYIMAHGVAEVRGEGATVLATYADGEAFSECGLAGEPSGETVVAATPAELWLLYKSDFEEVAAEFAPSGARHAPPEADGTPLLRV